MASVIRTSSGDVHVVPLATFMDSLLPQISPDINFNALVRHFKRVKAQKRQVITRNGRLWGYSKRIPSQLESSRVYLHVKSCITRLANRFPGKTVTFAFQDDRDFALCNTYSFPAAYFYAPPTDVSPTLDWTRIAVSGAYTLDTSHCGCDRVCSINLRDKGCIHSRSIRMRLKPFATCRDAWQRILGDASRTLLLSRIPIRGFGTVIEHVYSPPLRSTSSR